ncbi:MAG: type VI secretion system contractile sheath small subunit [Rhodothalassiaceae bacterium]
MAKEGSVAPKERINIKYTPATGDAQEEIELPLKLLMLGDYIGRADETPLEDRKRINITKDNFSDVMREQKLALDISVADKLSGDEDASLSMSLKFEDLKDFHPEQLVRQVPEMKTLLELREALQALKGPMGNVPAFRRALQEALADEGAREKLLKEMGLSEKADKA